MKKLKSILCLLLAMVMLLSFAACGGKGSTNGDSNADSSNKPNTSGGNTSSSSPDFERPAEAVTIRWMACDPGNPGRASVEEEVKRYVKEKLNVDLDIFWYPEADTAGTLSIEMITGEWDLAGIGAGLFKAYAPRNLFLPLDDYIDAYLPTAKEVLPEAAWQACSYNGQVLAACAAKDLAQNWGILINKTMLDEVGLEMPEGYGTLTELVPTMVEWTELFRDEYPNLYDTQIWDFSQWLPAWFTFEPFCGTFNTTLVCTNVPGEYGFDDYTSDTAFCPYFTDSFENHIQTLYQLKQDGIISPHGGEFTLGSHLGNVTCGYVEFVSDEYSEYERVWCSAGSPVISTAYLQEQIYVIRNGCKNPERVLQFLELLYSDEYLCTTLRFGVEGEDWSDEDNDGMVELIGRNADASNLYWYHWYGGANSSVLASKISPRSTLDFKDMIKELNATATVADNAGFYFDQEPVLNEIAACTNAMAPYISTMASPNNITDPDKLVSDFRAALKANGIDVIVAEVQRQLDEWRAANGK